MLIPYHFFHFFRVPNICFFSPTFFFRENAFFNFLLVFLFLLCRFALDFEFSLRPLSESESESGSVEEDIEEEEEEEEEEEAISVEEEELIEVVHPRSSSSLSLCFVLLVGGRERLVGAVGATAEDECKVASGEDTEGEEAHSWSFFLFRFASTHF